MNLWLILLSSLLPWTQSANILMYMPMGSRSHWYTWVPLANELAERGHDLTIVSPFPDKGLEARGNVNFMVTGHDMSVTIKSDQIFKGDFMLDPTEMTKSGLKVC